MRKILLLFILIFSLLGISSCGGELYGNEKCLIKTVLSEEKKTCVVSYNQYSQINPTYLTIPEYIDDYRVIAVVCDKDIFPKLTTLELPKSVTYFEGYASKLKKLIFNGSLEDFFNNFTNDKEEHLEFFYTISKLLYGKNSRYNYEYSYSLFGWSGSQFFVKENGEYKEIFNLVIPGNIKELPVGLFRCCSSIKSLTFLGNTDVSKECFYSCENLLDVSFPTDYYNLKIGETAFDSCTRLEKVSLPAKINEIKGFCNANIKEFTIPEGTVLVDIYGWSITKLYIPGSVRSLDVDAEKLKIIEIANGLEVLDDYAFSGCYKLNELILPNSIKRIGKMAFNVCYNLTTIKYNGTKAEWGSISFDSLWRKDSNVTKIICTDGIIDFNE